MIPQLLRTVILPALMLLFLSGPVAAQRGRAPEEMPGGSPMVSYEMALFPGTSPDTAEVDLQYRIQQQLFVFLRDPSGAVTAHGDLLAEIIDDNGSTAAREARPIVLQRSALPGQGESLPDIQDVIRFRLPKGKYTIVLEVKPAESGRSFLDRLRRFEVPSAITTAGILGQPVFGFADSSQHFIPFNRGGTVVFGSRGGALLQIRLPDSLADARLSWKLRPDGSTEGPPGQLFFEGSLDLPRPSGAERTAVRNAIVYVSRPANDTRWRSVYVPLPLQRLEAGVYALTVTLKAGAGSFEKVFQLPVQWPGQPASLRQFDLAVDALRHIATEEEIDAMIGFMADGGRQRFKEFWKKRSPDTTTAYNSVEEEYYRRVDEAIRRFSTRGDMDGYKTDRGRIMILFGIPTSMERVFRPTSGPREVWTYVPIRKRFIFSDPQRTGEYSLTQTEDL